MSDIQPSTEAIEAAYVDRYGHEREWPGNQRAALEGNLIAAYVIDAPAIHAAGVEEGRAERSLPRTDNRAYDLRQRLNRAVRWLREAEDIARVETPALVTADRIRDIYEQVTEDVLNGKASIPPLRERLAKAERRVDQARAEGRAAMRDEIVAWLRGHGTKHATHDWAAADAIEAAFPTTEGAA